MATTEPTTKKARITNDDYPTPRAVVRAILPHLPVGGLVLDPACGAGVLLEEAGVDMMWGTDVNVERVKEARAKGLDVWHRDALDPRPWTDSPRPSLVLMNPPFSRATDFVLRALTEVAPGGTVACLARLTFLEGVDRHERLYSIHGSPDVYVLPRRPRFRSDAKSATDTVTCAWFVWGPGRMGVLRHLPPSASDSDEEETR